MRARQQRRPLISSDAAALLTNGKDDPSVSSELPRSVSVLSRDSFLILEMLREAVNKESDRDSEHKLFTIMMVKVAATVSVAAVGWQLPR